MATVPPLHGDALVTLYPNAEEHPGKNPTKAVEVPLQGFPVVTLYPRPDAQPAGKEAVWALALFTPVKPIPPNITAIDKTKENMLIFIDYFSLIIHGSNFDYRLFSIPYKTKLGNVYYITTLQAHFFCCI
jgi:hypothetical protein